MLSVMAAVAEFERALLLERQREGIAVVKTKGVYKGRVPSLDEEQAGAVSIRLGEGDSASTLARELGVSRATVYNTRMRWSEEHTIAADDFYREHGVLDSKHPKLQALAERLGRVPTAVEMKLVELGKAHDEPGVYPGKRWNFSKLDRKVADRP